MKIERIGETPITRIEGKPAREFLAQWISRKVVILDTSGKTYVGLIKSIIQYDNEESITLSDEEARVPIKNIRLISDDVTNPLSLKNLVLKELFQQKDLDINNLQIPQELKEELRLERAIQMKDWKTLAEISGILSERGEFDKAIEVANMIASEWQSAAALEQICIILAESGSLAKAKEVADMSVHAGIASLIRLSLKKYDLAEALLRGGDVREEVGKMTVELGDRQMVAILRYVSEKFLKLGKFDSAIALADMIKYQWDKLEALRTIFGFLARNQLVDKAKEVYTLITLVKEDTEH